MSVSLQRPTLGSTPVILLSLDHVAQDRWLTEDLGLTITPSVLGRADHIIE